MADDVQNATGLEARRGFLIGEVHRHFHVDRRVLAEAQEVDMDDEVADHFALHVARDHTFDLAVDVDIERMAHERALVVKLGHDLGIDRNKFRGLLVAINNGGDAACETKRTNSPLAALRTCLGLERQCLGHGLDSPTKNAPKAGCPGRIRRFLQGCGRRLGRVIAAERLKLKPE